MRERLKLRFAPDEAAPEDALLDELLIIIADRICLRVGEAALPQALQSVCVDAALKLYRRQTSEGITVDGVTQTSFAQDVLEEYGTELDAYRTTAVGKRVVRFL